MIPRDRPDEIEITEEMIEAGALAGARYSPEWETPYTAAERIFRAMAVLEPGRNKRPHGGELDHFRVKHE
jgi:hypothetical protein